MGELINIRLRPANAPNTFYDQEHAMDTMLHELVHNVHTAHDEKFYSLLNVITKEWELLSSKGYQGQGFFSEGRKLGSGHRWFKSSLGVSRGDKKSIREAAERRGRGEIVDRTKGRTLGDTANGNQNGVVQPRPPLGGVYGPPQGGYGPPPGPYGSPPGPGIYGPLPGVYGPPPEPHPLQLRPGPYPPPPYPPQGPQPNGGRVVGGQGVNGWALSPREMAARAAEQRRKDQVRCGATQSGEEMKKESDRARREGTVTRAIDLNDLTLYDLDALDEEEAETEPPPSVRLPTPAPSTPEVEQTVQDSTVRTTGSTTGGQRVTFPTPRSTEPPRATEEALFHEPWTCHACTYLNPPLHLACEMCETDRRILTTETQAEVIDLTAEEEQFKISFTCPLCTYWNEESVDGVCKVCNVQT